MQRRFVLAQDMTGCVGRESTAGCSADSTGAEEIIGQIAQQVSVRQDDSKIPALELCLEILCPSDAHQPRYGLYDGMLGKKTYITG